MGCVTKHRFCSSSTGGLGHIVTTVGRRYLGKNHQLFFDNFFTSPVLVKELLQRKTYACGTCRVNRKGWPKDLVFSQKTKKSQRMKPGDVQIRQDGPVVETAWQDKHTITVLSSRVQPTMGIAMRQSGRGRLLSTFSFAVYHFYFLSVFFFFYFIKVT